MAEHVVSFVVEKLSQLLIQHAAFLLRVREKVEWLQNELKWMQCFLKDADAKQEGDELVRRWVADIRDVAYDAEDIVDEFILKGVSNRRRGIRDLLNWKLRKFGKKIEKIQNRIRDISHRQETYDLRKIGEGEGTSSANENLRQLRRSYPYVEDRDIIGLEKDVETLVAELIKEDERLHVISIVGMGGLGKTTLAKKIYNRNIVKHHFDCYAWVFISQQCRRRDVLQEIIEGVSKPTDQEMEMIGNMGGEKLALRLHNFLKGKKYLVVLDDIWTNDTWDVLKSAFPNGKIGSKLMLTTRNKDIARHVDATTFLHQPRLLSEEQSWELLCKKAFHGNASTNCPPNLEKMGREMVRKCGGLPLAVAVLGGLLATKEPHEWEIVSTHIGFHLSKEGQQGVEGILALSYNDLPYRLKPCFLYLGVFPEDSEIPTTKLIRLWVAEGFIRQEQGETMEDIGEEYVVEMINRCMVQMGTRSVMGRIKTIRLHDLMRDLCIKKAREENFLDIFYGDSNVPSANNKLRRKAIHRYHARYVSSAHSSPLIRTLLFFNPETFSPETSLKFIYQELKLLRVLDITNLKFNEKIILPKYIGKLIHLRYLGLRGTGIKEIPKESIGSLQSLQTLDLRVDFDRGEVPNVIWKMKQLRHLYLSYQFESSHLKVESLINLQTLWNIQAGNWIEKGLGSLTNIRKLGIRGLSRTQVKEVLNSNVFISEKCPLRSLGFELDNENQTFPDLEPLLCCHHLLKLRLNGHMENLQQWPPNLTRLTLSNSRLRQDPMATLQNLQDLTSLRLVRNSYEGKEMVCSAKGFPQLQFLILLGLGELEEWVVEEGAMPYLKQLQINDCKKLRMVPEGLRFATTLEELKIFRMPKGFKDRIRCEKGADWYKVQHIPSIQMD